MAAPQISWTNVLGAMSVFGMAISASWVVFQHQVTELKEAVTLARTEAKDRDAEAKHDRERQDAAIIRRLEGLITRDQHGDLKERLMAAEKRIDVIEQTRPTVGELSAIGKTTEMTLQRFEERLRTIEGRR